MFLKREEPREPGHKRQDAGHDQEHFDHGKRLFEEEGAFFLPNVFRPQSDIVFA